MCPRIHGYWLEFVFVCFFLALQVRSPWLFCRVRTAVRPQVEKRTWSSASRWLWLGARSVPAAGNRAWRKRWGSRCASALWSAATSSGMSAGTAAWTAGGASWSEVGLLEHWLYRGSRNWIRCRFLSLSPNPDCGVYNLNDQICFFGCQSRVHRL